MDDDKHDKPSDLLGLPRLREAADMFAKCGTYRVHIDDLPGYGAYLIVEKVPNYENSARLAYTHIDGSPSIATNVVVDFATAFNKRDPRLRIASAVVTFNQNPTDELVRSVAAYGIKILTFKKLLRILDQEFASNSIIAAEDEGYILPSPYRNQLVRSPAKLSTTVAFDRSAIEKVRAMAAYLDHIERAAANPTAPIQNVDITGMATGFRNWSEALYQALIVADARFSAAYKRANGSQLFGVERTFIIDPKRLKRSDLEYFIRTMQIHTDKGFKSNIIFAGQHTPERVISDFSILCRRTGFESGRLERLDPDDPAPQVSVVEEHTSRADFADFLDRIDWAMDKRNIAATIEDASDILGVVSEIEAILTSLENSQRPALEPQTRVGDRSAKNSNRDKVIARVSYGRTIKHLRTTHKLKQSKLADRICETLDKQIPGDPPHTLDDNTLSAWETGRNETAEKYVAALKAIFPEWKEAFSMFFSETFDRARLRPDLQGDDLRTYLLKG